MVILLKMLRLYRSFWGGPRDVYHGFEPIDALKYLLKRVF